jgi:hypothetical protein
VIAQRDRDITIERWHPAADPAYIVRGIVRRGLYDAHLETLKREGLI